MTVRLLSEVSAMSYKGGVRLQYFVTVSHEFVKSYPVDSETRLADQNECSTVPCVQIS